jgi:hypothetical protein
MICLLPSTRDVDEYVKAHIRRPIHAFSSAKMECDIDGSMIRVYASWTRYLTFMIYT